MSEPAPEKPRVKSGLADASGMGRALAAKLFGDPSSVDLEQRLFRGIMLLASLAGVVATILNLLIGTSMLMVAAGIVSFIAGAVGYWLAHRMRRWRLLLVPVLLSFLVILAASWITQAGSEGTIGYYFFILLCYTALFFRRAGKILALLLMASTVGALLLFEHLFPSAIV